MSQQFGGGGGEDACSASGNFSFVIGMSLRLAGIRAGRKQIRVPTLSNMKGREIAVALGNGNCERNSSCVVHESWIIDIPLSRGGGYATAALSSSPRRRGGGGAFPETPGSLENERANGGGKAVFSPEVIIPGASSGSGNVINRWAGISSAVRKPSAVTLASILVRAKLQRLSELFADVESKFVFWRFCVSAFPSATRCRSSRTVCSVEGKARFVFVNVTRPCGDLEILIETVCILRRRTTLCFVKTK